MGDSYCIRFLFDVGFMYFILVFDYFLIFLFQEKSLFTVTFNAFHLQFFRPSVVRCLQEEIKMKIYEAMLSNFKIEKRS